MAFHLLCLVACAACLLGGRAGGAAGLAVAGQDLDAGTPAAAAAANLLPAASAAAAVEQQQLQGRRLHVNATVAHPQQQKQHQQQQRNATAAKPVKHRMAQWKGRRRPCDADDAKCIALRDHDCDPYYQTVEDKCVVA